MVGGATCHFSRHARRARVTRSTGRSEWNLPYVHHVVESERRAATRRQHTSPNRKLRKKRNALATLREAIDVYAAVARNQSDRGSIAVAVEYGYRPLEKKIAELKQGTNNTAAAH